jgi:hypothetical protein
MPTFVLSVPELSTYWGDDRPISVLVTLFICFIFSTAQRFSIKYCTKDAVLYVERETIIVAFKITTIPS